MQRIISTLILISIFLVFFACGGAKKAGMVHVQLEDDLLQAQVELLQDKIEENPNNIEYRKQLAEVYYQGGKGREALLVLDKAFVIDPSNAESKYLYAEIALSIGDRLKAYRAYKDVLQGSEGQAYLDRIAPKFADAFDVEKVIGTDANEAFGNFSKDGNKIIYQSDQNGNWDIFEYDMISGTTTQLTFSPAHEENPDISPDGKKIIYTSTIEDHRDVNYDQKLRDIFVMDIKSKEKRNLTTNGSNDWRPRFSKDGKHISFVSERDDLREVPFYELFSNVYIMESDGRFQLHLTEVQANNGNPCILPGSTDDKGKVYFDSNSNGLYAIYTVDFKGKNLRQVTFNLNTNDVSPDVSSNGDKVVYFSDRDGNYEIYLMNNDGSAQQRLTSNPSDDLNPLFSPDGINVLFHSNRSGSYDLYLLDLSQQTEALPLHEVVGKIDQAMQGLQ
jgi:TolB protein